MFLYDYEKQVLIRLLFEIINADAIISDNEVNLFKKIQSHYSISDADVVRAKKMPATKALDILHTMEDTKKAIIYEIFQEMGRVDQEPFPETLEMINLITIKARLLEPVKRYRQKHEADERLRNIF